MGIGLIGKKCGMTRLYLENGEGVPATVLEVLPMRVVQIKTEEREGYRAVQMTSGAASRRITKARAKHFAKANVTAGKWLHEFRLKENEAEPVIGSESHLDGFKVGDYVDISGITKGKGFAGTIKRHHFRSQRASHGNSLSHNAPGSIGQRQTPGRVFPGKRMSGHLGNVWRTVQNLPVLQILPAQNLLLIKGAVPGSSASFLVIKHAVKKEGK